MKTTDSDGCWQGHRESRTLIGGWRGGDVVWPFWKTGWQPLPGLNVEPPRDLTILLLGAYPGSVKTYVRKKGLFPTVDGNVIHVAEKWTRSWRPASGDAWANRTWSSRAV